MTLRYPGQKQTCARCHEVSTYCPGGGIARKCEAAGGIKVELGHYIVELWKKIGYSPGVLEYAAAHDEHGEDLDQVAVGSPLPATDFTPVKVVTEPEKFTGVIVKQFPKGADSGDIMDFLVRAGLPAEYKENVVMKSNGYVTISNLENNVCRVLIEYIHGKNHFDRKLYCNGIIPLTPEKNAATVSTSTPPSASTSPSRGPPGQPPPAGVTPAPPSDGPGRSTSPSVSVLAPPTPTARQEVATIADTVPPVSVSEYPCNDRVLTEQTHPDEFDKLPRADEEFVRRHSLSLRTPPPGSLAKEILSSSNFTKTKNLLNEMKLVSDALSDFNSCMSSLSASSAGEDSNQDVSEPVPLPQALRNKKKKKRKHSATPPDKNLFLKKVNSGKGPEGLAPDL